MNFDTFKAAAIDFFKIETFPLCHPGGASGYKVSAFNKSIVYALDHEFGLEKKIDNGLLKSNSPFDSSHSHQLNLPTSIMAYLQLN